MITKSGILKTFILTLFAFFVVLNVGAADKKFRVGVSVAYFNHPVYQLEMKGMKEVAEQQGDLDMTFLDGKNDGAEQSAQLDAFIAQKMDAIILMPAVSDPMLPAIKRVNNAKIPFLIVDRKMWTRGTGVKWDAMVNWDMSLSGTIAGSEIVALMKGKGNLVYVGGTPGAGSTIDKDTAAFAIIDQFPLINLVYKTNADFRRDKGLLVVQDILAKFPKGTIDCLWTMNDEMTLGALEAIKAAGRLHEFKIVSGDGDHDAMAALRRGDIDATNLFHPDDHAAAILVLEKILHKQKLDRKEIFTVFGRKVPYAPDHEGMPWVRPTDYWVDKENCNLPEFVGW